MPVAYHKKKSSSSMGPAAMPSGAFSASCLYSVRRRLKAFAGDAAMGARTTQLATDCFFTRQIKFY